MPFSKRTGASNKLISYLEQYYWSNEEIKRYRLIQHPYGYENYFAPELQEKMRQRYTPTTEYIRYAPDYFLIQENTNNDILLEYKVTKTPRYSFGRSQWNYGQIEADAFDNYIKLTDIGVDVAIIIYCPYHPRPLLCGKPSRDWVYGIRQRTNNSNGSGTDFYNIDLNKLNSFSKYMNDKFNIPIAITKKILNRKIFDIIKNDSDLITEHDSQSFFNDGKHQTGFNWTINDNYYNS
jgi:hypothetical protein